MMGETLGEERNKKNGGCDAAILAWAVHEALKQINKNWLNESARSRKIQYTSPTASLSWRKPACSIHIASIEAYSRSLRNAYLRGLALCNEGYGRYEA
jgi:hypothetical protein